MNKNLIEIYKQCRTEPTTGDHIVVVVLGLSIYYSFIVSNYAVLIAFATILIFKLIGYITYLVTPTKKIDEVETSRAKRIYRLLEN